MVSFSIFENKFMNSYNDISQEIYNMRCKPLTFYLSRGMLVTSLKSLCLLTKVILKQNNQLILSNLFK